MKIEKKYRFGNENYELIEIKNNIKLFISDDERTALITDTVDNILFKLDADNHLKLDPTIK